MVVKKPTLILLVVQYLMTDNLSKKIVKMPRKARFSFDKRMPNDANVESFIKRSSA